MTGIVKTDQIQGAGSSTVTIPTGNTLAVTDNATVGGTLGVTGTATLSGNATIGSNTGDTRFHLNSANQYTMKFSNAGNVAGHLGGGGSDILRFSNAAGNTIMQMDVGRITMPLQPIAEAYYSAATQDGAYNATTRNYVVCKPGATHVNVGSMYDSSTGRFTVPVAGRYLAMVNGSQYNSGISSYHYVYIRKNGTMQKMIYNSLSSGSSGWTAMSGSTTFDCAANDYIDFENRHDSNNSQRGGWDVGGYTKFTVMLLT